MPRYVLPVILAIILVFAGIQAAFAYDSISDGTLVLEEIMEYLTRYHLEEPEVDKLVNGAIKGMLDILGDPFTEYFSPEELEQFTRSLDGSLFGIGVELSPGVSYPGVLRVIPRSPAEKAGIKAGDLIVAVDGMDLKNLDLLEVVQKIRGPEGTSVKITVDRPGKGRINFIIIRKNVSIPTVEFRVFDSRVGYINVSFFGSKTADEFDKALHDLLSRGINCLVLDLRNNRGGYLQAAVDIASQFLPPGSPVVLTEDRKGNRKTYVTSGYPAALRMPVAVLVNNDTASAAEVLAGALRDHGLAMLVGGCTFGKGVLQTVIPLETGGALKVTTHRYFTPSGINLDGNGLIPDREILTPELQVAAALQVLKNNNILELEFNIKDSKIRVNGQEIEYPFMPLVESGHLFLPLRLTLEALGYRVSPSEKGVRISGFGDTMEVYPGSSNLRLNGEEKVLNRAVLIDRGVRYISYQALKLLTLEIERGSGKVYVRSLQAGTPEGICRKTVSSVE